jgi:cytochrome c oxidase subunit III
VQQGAPDDEMANPQPIAVNDPHAAHGGGHAHAGHPSHLQHHFVSSEQQFDAAKLGMWLFLVTEILLFGGMFVAYGIFRAMYPELFLEASTQLDPVMGALNTGVLLLSSLTVALAINGAQRDKPKMLFWNLIFTVLLAGVFMVVKYFEYTHKFEIGIFPGGGFAAEELVTHIRAGIFFSIYYVMTGIHGIHVIIGMGMISWLAIRARKGHFTSAYYTPVENVGLYWHVVDVIWIFLFPLMYLIA